MVVFVKDVGVVLIEIKPWNTDSHIKKAEGQLKNIQGFLSRVY